MIEQMNFRAILCLVSTLKRLKYDTQKIYNETESILMNIPKSPFEIRLTIGQHYKWKNEAGVISLNLKRVSLGLLLGSFYVPTGIFAALSVGSYVINPDIVSTGCTMWKLLCEIKFRSVIHFFYTGSWKNGLTNYKLSNCFKCLWVNQGSTE